MNYFINYSVNTGITIDSSRSPDATCCDIGDIASALTNYESESLVCSLDNEALELLEDESYWSGVDASAGTLDALHELILKHRKELVSLSK